MSSVRQVLAAAERQPRCRLAPPISGCARLPRRAGWFIAGLAIAALVGRPVVADDTELFLGTSSPAVQGRPNILLLFDDSVSMGTTMRARAAYDPATTYAGGCAADRIYWKTANRTDEVPDCRTRRYFNAGALRCRRGMTTLAENGVYRGTLAQFDAVGDIQWEAVSQNERAAPVECAADSGSINPPGHGDGVDSAAVYAQNGDAAQPWSTVAADEIAWTRHSNYVLYSGNYLNWSHNGPMTDVSRIDVTKQAATELLDAIDGVNVGIMQAGGEHGIRVSHAIEDIATARASLKAAVGALEPNGTSPLSEALYEAGLYLMGRAVDQGVLSVPAATDAGGTRYASPLEFSCQKNVVVALTDGEPTDDANREAQIRALRDEAAQGFDELVGGSCDVDAYAPGIDVTGDDCLDEMAEFLFAGDLSALPGRQNAQTYTVGIGVDWPALRDSAERGGGEFRMAGRATSLAALLSDYVVDAVDNVETQASFTPLAVPVDSFNRTRHINDLFIGVFRPTTTVHWPGNLKKFSLRVSDNAIVGADGSPAVDPGTGFFRSDSRSFWSAVNDPKVAEGGAASRLPAPAVRNVYTHLDGNPADLTHASNAISHANPAIDDAVLESGHPGGPARDEVIDFVRGAVAGGSEVRRELGDPLHSAPLAMIYDGADPDAALVFVATNDGFLHAINANTGVEQWAFIPRELLDDQVRLKANRRTSSRRYGIDGALRLQTLADDDGVIDPATEKVYLFFGLRRGGTVYYALDVSNRHSPRLLWRLGSADLPGNGQSWAAPVPARIDVNSAAQGGNKLVVVLGGGYDPTQDGYDNAADSIGNAIYIVDSETGELLWHGSRSEGDKTFPAMQSSFAADVKVVDLGADGLADRMYAADMGGQVWRFDIHNGNGPSGLISGGVIAQLGAAPLPAPPDVAPDGPDNRRFYYAPDVALVSSRRERFMHIGIGSGYRAHPLSTANHDRFYALRDHAPFRTLSDSDYARIEPVVDADLVDVTDNADATVPPGGPGWRLELRDRGWIGEKVHAEARTFNNRVYFTTLVPGSADSSVDPCSPAPTTNRLYVVDLIDGSPVTDLDGDATPGEPEDRYVELPGASTSEMVFVFPAPDDPDNCLGSECSPPPVACVGLHCIPTEFPSGPVRTYWVQEGID